MIKTAYLSKIFQILVAGGIFFFLLTKVDLHHITMMIRHASLFHLGLALVILMVSIIGVSYRWLELLHLAGYSPPIASCIGTFSTSILINYTLPGGFSGDVMRTWFTRHYGIPTGIAASSVISDRVLGIAGYAFFVSIIILLHLLWTNESKQMTYTISLLFSAVIILGCAGLILLTPFFDYIKWQVPWILSPLMHLSKMMGLLFKHPKQLVVFMTMDIVAHIAQVIGILLIFYALDISLSLQAACIGIPIVLLCSAVPLTPGNWGVREGMMVFVLQQYQVDTEAAFGASVLFGLFSILSCVPFSAVWFFFQNPRKAAILQ